MVQIKLDLDDFNEHRLRLCERCGRLMTPHAFTVHEKNMQCLSETELDELNIFQVKFSPQQVKLYDRETYYADVHMFDGLSKDCIPKGYLSSHHPKILDLLAPRFSPWG